MSNIIIFLISETLINSQTLILAGLGGLISEKSGIINIGLEGIMTIGAFSGAAVAYFTNDPLFSIFVGGLAGLALATLHAVFTIFLKSDQIITGMALNFLGPAIAVFISTLIFTSISTPPIEIKLPILFDGIFSKTSFIFQIFGKRYSVYIAMLGVILFHIVFKYTKIGLRINASGENPEVLESVGVSVNKIRFFCVLFSGFLAGVSGAVLTTVIASSYVQGITGGQGFIAIVMLIFGKWTPLGVLMGSFLFSFVKTLAVVLAQSPFLSLIMPPKMLVIAPYLIVILSLIFFSKKNYAPKFLGISYKKH
ncbi:ABC transporter permease [Borreliella lusitaniae]|uniref:ABC transporter permease n=1 Tax=Borreliella lusitaniae TaxID=100177 RepID=UPI00292D2173|nr:ABC transporter permease [Borreliella lusitaniae]WNY67010.1 ABC transporter permease [Borreliella lusitaniae]